MDFRPMGSKIPSVVGTFFPSPLPRAHLCFLMLHKILLHGQIKGFFPGIPPSVFPAIAEKAIFERYSFSPSVRDISHEAPFTGKTLSFPF